MLVCLVGCSRCSLQGFSYTQHGGTGEATLAVEHDTLGGTREDKEFDDAVVAPGQVGATGAAEEYMCVISNGGHPHSFIALMAVFSLSFGNLFHHYVMPCALRRVIHEGAQII